MRIVQVGIQVERFGEAAPDGNRHAFTVYADANNAYEAICAAFYETLERIKQHSELPSFGRRESDERLIGSRTGVRPLSEDIELQKMLNNEYDVSEIVIDGLPLCPKHEKLKEARDNGTITEVEYMIITKYRQQHYTMKE